MRVSLGVAALKRIIPWLPTNGLRVAGHRILGYQIGDRVRVGRKTLISARRCVLGDDVMIGANCTISAGEFIVGRGTKIHSGNHFIGSGRALLGSGIRVINDHFFDLSNDIMIGNGSWVAGRGSQFSTHGHTRKTEDPSIVIGDGVYIGSSTLFAPGSGVADGTLVGLGSVVTKRFEARNCLIAGNPAELRRLNFAWNQDWA